MAGMTEARSSADVPASPGGANPGNVSPLATDNDFGEDDADLAGEMEDEEEAAAEDDDEAEGVAGLPGVPAQVSRMPTQQATDHNVSRLQVLEYLNKRSWWSQGQTALLFTMLMWSVFILIVYMRSDVEASFALHDALVHHVERIVAHPSLSGVPLLTPVERPVPCRCACRSASKPSPAGPCDTEESEMLNFLGQLPSESAQTLLANAYGEASGGGSMTPFGWNDIGSAEDAWLWVEHGLLPDVWGTIGFDGVSRPGLMLRRNLVVGGVRAQQRRAKLADKCEVADKLQSFYAGECRSSDLAKDPYGPAGGAASPKTVAGGAFVPASGEGKESLFEASFDIERPLSIALEHATLLRRERWLDGSTRSLEIQALMLNAEARIYAVLSISFKFPFNGGVEKRVDAHTLPAMSTDNIKIQEYIPEMVWLALIVILLRQEIVQICVMTYQRRLGAYFKDLWNIVDWLSIILGAAIGWYWFWIVMQTTDVSKAIVALPQAPLPPDLDLAAYHKDCSKILDDISGVVMLKRYHELCLFAYTSMITLRFLKGFLGQSKLAMIQMSLTHAFWDVLHFMIIFILMFINFVLGGRILFGSELKDWSSYARAANAAVRMLMGSSNFNEMYEIHPWVASIWIVLFLLSMFFILANLLLVIMIDHYCALKKSIGPTPTAWSDFANGCREWFWRMGWRWETFKEGEYRESIGNPYADTYETLTEACKMTEQMQQSGQASCLGLRVSIAQMENMSPEGLASEANPGAAPVSIMELRKCGVDPTAAKHLLDEVARFSEQQVDIKMQTQLRRVRQFVKLVRRHGQQLTKHCELIEAGLEEEDEALNDSFGRLEQGVKEALEDLSVLRTQGVESLAPQPLGQGGEMKATISESFRSTAARQSLAHSGNPSMLRQAALAIQGAEIGAGQPALANPATTSLALTNGSPPGRPRPPALTN